MPKPNYIQRMLQMDDTPISNSHLSQPARYVAERLGIKTYGDLRKLTLEQIDQSRIGKIPARAELSNFRNEIGDKQPGK